jgi:catechol 2,3-dioxygenase-like lactoylglutathione lyase family enzyme
LALLSDGAMLGRFLEIGIATTDIRASVEFYERLGFTQAQTGDTWAHPYGVLTDGRLCIGLHQSRLDSPALTFVRPDIAGHVAALQRMGIEPSTVNIGAEVFNELGFRDPAGQAVRLLEARTYSPSDRSALEPSGCGAFRGLSMPAADFERVRRFWEALGFAVGEREAHPYPHLPLAGEGLELTLHRPQLAAEPLLTFRDPAMTERLALLREQALYPLEPPPRGLDPRGNALLRAPEGTGLLLLQDPVAAN